VTITAPYDLSALADATLILIPGWNKVDEPVPDDLIAAIQTAHANGARIASICSGVFVLAAAGLLDGRQATTHWLLVDKLREHFPLVNINGDVLYVDEGDVLTSAGSAAGLDLCMHIVRQDWGVRCANVVARRLLLPAQREGGQRQFVAAPVPKERGGQISVLLDRIKMELNEAWPVARMAKEAGLSGRTLARRFRDATGETPLAWLTSMRIQHATELLESTSATLSDITAASGFVTPETFRREFKRLRGISPSRYRIAFGKKAP
jgi:AraC family transcriptional activator FtrA